MRKHVYQDGGFAEAYQKATDYSAKGVPMLPPPLLKLQRSLDKGMEMKGINEKLSLMNDEDPNYRALTELYKMQRGGNVDPVARTPDDYKMGILKGKTVFKYERPGPQSMTMNTPGGTVPYPVKYAGLTNGEVTDTGVAYPGEDFTVYGDTVVESKLDMKQPIKYFMKGGKLFKNSAPKYQDGGMIVPPKSLGAPGPNPSAAQNMYDQRMTENLGHELASRANRLNSIQEEEEGRKAMKSTAQFMGGNTENDYSQMESSIMPEYDMPEGSQGYSIEDDPEYIEMIENGFTPDEALDMMERMVEVEADESGNISQDEGYPGVDIQRIPPPNEIVPDEELGRSTFVDQFGEEPDSYTGLNNMDEVRASQQGATVETDPEGETWTDADVSNTMLIPDDVEGASSVALPGEKEKPKGTWSNKDVYANANQAGLLKDEKLDDIGEAMIESFVPSDFVTSLDNIPGQPFIQGRDDAYYNITKNPRALTSAFNSTLRMLSKQVDDGVNPEDALNATLPSQNTTFAEYLRETYDVQPEDVQEILSDYQADPSDNNKFDMFMNVHNTRTRGMGYFNKTVGDAVRTFKSGTDFAGRDEEYLEGISGKYFDSGIKNAEEALQSKVVKGPATIFRNNPILNSILTGNADSNFQFENFDGIDIPALLKASDDNPRSYVQARANLENNLFLPMQSEYNKSNQMLSSIKLAMNAASDSERPALQRQFDTQLARHNNMREALKELSIVGYYYDSKVEELVPQYNDRKNEKHSRFKSLAKQRKNELESVEGRKNLDYLERAIDAYQSKPSISRYMQYDMPVIGTGVASTLTNPNDPDYVLPEEMAGNVEYGNIINILKRAGKLEYGVEDLVPKPPKPTPKPKSSSRSSAKPKPSLPTIPNFLGVPKPPRAGEARKQSREVNRPKATPGRKYETLQEAPKNRRGKASGFDKYKVISDMTHQDGGYTSKSPKYIPGQVIKYRMGGQIHEGVFDSYDSQTGKIKLR